MVDKYYCALCSNLEIDRKDKKVLCFDVNNLGTTQPIRIQCDGAVDAEQWLRDMTPLMPRKIGMLAALDNVGSQVPRFAAYQCGCLFLFNVSRDKKKNYQLAKTYPAGKCRCTAQTKTSCCGCDSNYAVLDYSVLCSVTVTKPPHVFELKEQESGKVFKYQQSDSKGDIWAEFLALEFKSYNDKVTGDADAKKLRTKNLFRKIKVSASLIAAFASESEQGKARTLAELEEKRRLEDEEDIRLDALEAEEEEAHVQLQKSTFKKNAAAAEQKKAERLAARQDVGQLREQIDEMQAESQNLADALVKAKVSRHEVELELANEEAATKSKIEHVKTMVEELRKLSKGKLPVWLERELKVEEQSGAKRKRLSWETEDSKASDADLATFASTALAADDGYLAN
eukprot:SAG31_NODE_1036_length_10221_cov_170.602326_4_plen_398_part_00